MHVLLSYSPMTALTTKRPQRVRAQRWAVDPQSRFFLLFFFLLSRSSNSHESLLMTHHRSMASQIRGVDTRPRCCRVRASHTVLLKQPKQWDTNVSKTALHKTEKTTGLNIRNSSTMFTFYNFKYWNLGQNWHVLLYLSICAQKPNMSYSEDLRFPLKIWTHSGLPASNVQGW